MITVFYHPDSAPPPSSTLVLLGIGRGDSVACDQASSGVTSSYYINDPDFIDATVLATDSGLSNLAVAAYYSDGLIWRYWNGSAFTGVSGLCEFFEP